MAFRSFLFTAALLTHTVVAHADPTIAIKPGGWSEVDVTDEGVIAAAAFAVRAQQAAMREDDDQEQLTLEQVESAEQQVVQGMNYRLTLRVRHAGKDRMAEAVVWARVWLDEAERYQLTSWRFTETIPRADRWLR